MIVLITAMTIWLPFITVTRLEIFTYTSPDDVKLFPHLLPRPNRWFNISKENCGLYTVNVLRSRLKHNISIIRSFLVTDVQGTEVIRAAAYSLASKLLAESFILQVIKVLRSQINPRWCEMLPLVLLSGRNGLNTDILCFSTKSVFGITRRPLVEFFEPGRPDLLFLKCTNPIWTSCSDRKGNIVTCELSMSTGCANCGYNLTRSDFAWFLVTVRPSWFTVSIML